jgi:type VI secretion system protein ImpF
MVDIAKRNRLGPPLMYVFRDAHRKGDAKTSGRSGTGASAAPKPRARTVQRSAITEKALREDLVLDLEALMNCVSLDSTLNLTEFPTVSKSILNFGFPDIAHRSIDELAASDIDGEIEAVLRRYEPRLVPNTIRVIRDKNIDPAALKIRYLVHGDLMCEPLNVPIDFVADVEVNTGKFRINRL